MGSTTGVVLPQGLKATMDEASKPQLEVLSIHAAGNWSGGDQARLGDLTAQAMLKYSVKDYNTAAELYSQATELQAEINGEMSSLNADLLYAYGRCLYHVAVRNSDVLGSKVAGEKREDKVKSLGHRNREPKRDNNGTGDDQTRITAEVSQQVVEEKDRMIESVEGLDNKSKPYFQFTGDENFDDSDGEEETAGGNDENEEADDEDDDFVNAYEVLDLARVLLLRRLEDAQDSKSKGSGNGKVVGDSQIAKQLKERLADTHDLQAEISLEGERFPEAVLDLKAALALKQELFPQESSLLAEAHYKLSLALEFSSVTQPKNEDDSALTGEEAHVDEGMREDAAKEMEAAIASCKLRIEQEEARLHASAAATGGTGNPKLKKEDIKNVKEMIRDMEQRVSHVSAAWIRYRCADHVIARRTTAASSLHQ